MGRSQREKLPGVTCFTDNSIRNSERARRFEVVHRRNCWGVPGRRICEWQLPCVMRTA